MTDLAVPILTMSTAAIALFGILARSLRGRGWAIAAAVVGAGMLLAHALWLNGNPRITRLIPSADVIVWGNFSPLFTSFLAAGAWVKMTGPPWQRVLMAVALFGVCFFMAYQPLLGSPPSLQPPRWSQDVCRQSTTATCSAAAAATLLRELGIDAEEAEMTRLCLTRDWGTVTLGLYRGLKLKSARRVRVLQTDLESVLALHRPVIISIGLPGNDSSTLLNLGNSHSVVLFRQIDNTADIGDPFAGRQRWPLEQLRQAWQHEAFVVD